MRYLPLTDADRRRTILAAAPEVLARYSWAECASRILRILEDVV